MANPAARTEAPESNEKKTAALALTQAAIDAAHGTTGWSAYDVWRKRVFEPQADAGNPSAGKPSSD